MSDRRSGTRCPICQGPAVDDPKSPGGIRCRNSTCTHNHAAQTCPRCKKQDLESVALAGGKWKLTCRECLNVWTP